MGRLWAVGVCLLLLGCSEALAVGPAPIPLWPEGAPGAVGSGEEDTPTVRVYSPEKPNGAAIVICPGGGYGILAYDHEGTQIAQWLNSIGVTGVVLQYRHAPKYRHPTPLGDAQRAIRYVRANAAALKVSPSRIGVMGFSAGGHLASTVSTHFDAGTADAKDPIDRVSCRPDFSVLCYPVISLKDDYAHGGSAKNLLGEKASDPALLENLSNYTQVNDKTPPAFLFHTNEDKGVRVENALAYYSALVKHNVPAEMHVYQNGPHGVGLADGEPGAKNWRVELAAWLQTNGFLFDGQRSEVTGSVTLDGKPMRWGSITIESETPNAPTAWAMISGGKFSIPAFRGAVVGNCRITVRNLGSVEPRPTIEDVQTVSPSGLVFQIKADSKNELSLDLKSK